MGQRLELQALLVSILGSKNVYFQPPDSKQLQFPCIVYRRDDILMEHADNKPYISRKRYQVTVIDSNPDSEIPDKVAELPTCRFDRHFTANQHNHDVYNLFF